MVCESHELESAAPRWLQVRLQVCVAAVPSANIRGRGAFTTSGCAEQCHVAQSGSAHRVLQTPLATAVVA
jgi:hypothetical protein